MVDKEHSAVSLPRFVTLYLRSLPCCRSFPGFPLALLSNLPWFSKASGFSFLFVISNLGLNWQCMTCPSPKFSNDPPSELAGSPFPEGYPQLSAYHQRRDDWQISNPLMTVSFSIQDSLILNSIQFTDTGYAQYLVSTLGPCLISSALQAMFGNMGLQ